MLSRIGGKKCYLWPGEFCTICSLFYLYRCWEFKILKDTVVTDYQCFLSFVTNWISRQDVCPWECAAHWVADVCLAVGEKKNHCWKTWSLISPTSLCFFLMHRLLNPKVISSKAENINSSLCPDTLERACNVLTRRECNWIPPCLYERWFSKLLSLLWKSAIKPPIFIYPLGMF